MFLVFFTVQYQVLCPTSTVPGFLKYCAMFFHAIYLTVDHTQILQTRRPCVALLLVL